MLNAGTRSGGPWDSSEGAAPAAPGQGCTGVLGGSALPVPRPRPTPQAASRARQQHLSALRDYMQRCTNELYWLDRQAKGRVQYDWSDRNLDYPSRRRQYEVRRGPGLWGKGEGARRAAPHPTPTPCRISSTATWRPKRRELTSCTARGTSCWPPSTPGGTPLRCVFPGKGCLLQGDLRQPFRLRVPHPVSVCFYVVLSFFARSDPVCSLVFSFTTSCPGPLGF